MSHVTVNGVRLAFHEQGQGPALVLVHGVAATSAMWEPHLATLSRRCRVVTYDARGHGASDAPEGAEAYAEEVFVEDLRQLLAHLGIQRAYIAGLSMGANIALRFGLAYPEAVDGLVLCGAGSGSDDPAAWRERWLGVAALIEQKGLEAFAAAFMASPLVSRYAGRSPEAAAWVRRMLTGHRPEGIAHTARGLQATRPPVYALAADLRTFDRPALVLVGEHDALSANPSRFLAETLPHGKLIVVRDAGHLVPGEAPEVFEGTVEALVDA